MVFVTKADGERQPYSEEKIISGIRRAGVPVKLQNQVLSHVKSKLYEGVSTSEIYGHIVEFLGRSSHPYTAAKFSLKQAIMALGPTGYPFEDFLGRLLTAFGYQTSVRNIMQGKCITHEVDVVAQKNSEKIMIEAKYHNLAGAKTNVHVALYTKARFNDLIERNNLNQAWLITNTKITQDAIAYSLCMGMKVISWNYPTGDSLRDMIEKSGLSPITALTSLSEKEKQTLSKNRIMLAKDICHDKECLNVLKLPSQKHSEVIREASFVSEM